MGASYSQSTLKTQLKMATQRLMMHRNKKQNQIAVDSKTVAILLQQSKDESARIRCEAILHEKNMCTAYELLQLMLELMTTRVQLITASKVKACPTDLEEGVASVIYCSTRVEVPELNTIAEQLGAKFTKEWAMAHVDNQSGKVNQRIIDKLSIQPPPFEVVLEMLHSIARQYSVDWQPDMAALESGIVDHSNPERLGTIARVAVPAPGPLADGPQPIAVPQQQPASAAGSSPSAASYPSMLAQAPRGGVGFTAPAPMNQTYPVADAHLNAPSLDGYAPGAPSPFPGTLNIILHRARQILNLASSSEPHDLYVRLTNLATGVQYKTDHDPHGRDNPIWFGNPHLPANTLHHFPFSIQEATEQIEVAVLQKNVGTFKVSEDKLLGSATFYADNLRANAQLLWYGIYTKNMQVGFLLMATQYLPLNASILSQDELDQQHQWQREEQRQAQLTTPGDGGGGVNVLASSIPGGPSTSSSSSVGSSQVDPSRGSVGYPSGRNNSLSDRLKGLFHEPPESPPHNHTKNLSDLHTAQTAAGASAGNPTSRRHEGRTPAEEKTDLDPAPYAAAAPAAPAPAAPASAAAAGLDFDLPEVPTHSAGAGRKSPNAGGSGSSNSKPPSNTGSSGGGMGGTLYATRPAPQKKRDEDAELEARFNRLK